MHELLTLQHIAIYSTHVLSLSTPSLLLLFIVKERCTHYVMHMYICMNMHGSYDNAGGVAYNYDKYTDKQYNDITCVTIST